MDAVSEISAGDVTQNLAVLRGLHSFRVAGCVLETWREHASSGKVYTRCRITKEPPDLPDGPYRVEFAGQSIRTRKCEGEWELVFLAPDIKIPGAA